MELKWGLKPCNSKDIETLVCIQLQLNSIGTTNSISFYGFDIYTLYYSSPCAYHTLEEHQGPLTAWPRKPSDPTQVMSRNPVLSLGVDHSDIPAQLRSRNGVPCSSADCLAAKIAPTSQREGEDGQLSVTSSSWASPRPPHWWWFFMPWGFFVVFGVESQTDREWSKKVTACLSLDFNVEV